MNKERVAEEPKPLRELFHFSHFSHFYRLYVPASILIGVVCGLFMIAFQVLIDMSITAFSFIPVYLAPIIGGIFSGLFIYVGAREIEGSGISKAIEMTHHPGELKARTAITKLAATSVSIGTGNPVGREGPAVLIGAALGNHLGRVFGYDDPPHLRVFIMMGSAAATAGIYKAPLGGALFATEAPYKRDARLGYFVPTVLASITSYIVFILAMGIHPLFTFNASFVFSLEIIPLFVIFSILAGLISIVFSVVLMVTRNFFRIRLPDWADPVAGALLACIVLFIIALTVDPTVYPDLTVSGLGYETINAIATSTIPIGILLVLLIGKLFASSFVVAGRVSGGVLASSIFVGAALGAIFAELFSPANQPVFVVLGMAAVLAATTNTPVATMILMLEMSHSFELVIPLAICVCISYLVGGGTSLYEGQKLTRDDEEPGMYARVEIPPEPELGIVSNTPSTNQFNEDIGLEDDDE